MPTTTRRGMALRAHRERLRARGLVRLELRVGRQDVPLLRQVAEALADPARADAARALLRARFAPPRPPSFKAYLETAPLDGVPIERDPDTGRDIAL